VIIGVTVWLSAHRREQADKEKSNGPNYLGLTKEQTMNYVLASFKEVVMFRAVVEEAAALASVSLFIGMIAIWAQVLSTL
jgi:hypothetical protein